MPQAKVVSACERGHHWPFALALFEQSLQEAALETGWTEVPGRWSNHVRVTYADVSL